MCLSAFISWCPYFGLLFGSSLGTSKPLFVFLHEECQETIISLKESIFNCIHQLMVPYSVGLLKAKRALEWQGSGF